MLQEQWRYKSLFIKTKMRDTQEVLSAVGAATSDELDDYNMWSLADA